jgi:chemotaxis protein methyltransferase CheR
MDVRNQVKREGSAMSSSEFLHISKLVYTQCGINLEEQKKVLLESRIQKRLRALDMHSFKEYIQYISGKEGIANELVHMIDVVTTNKTDFFRESSHFDFLVQTVFPEIMNSGNKRLNAWSAACSSGEEPYTLAMVMEDFERVHPGFTYSIFASDISTQVLHKASLAIYTLQQAIDIPLEFKKKYLLKSKDSTKPTVRIIPELRKKVRFARVNFMDNVLPVEETFDIIFCRNVLIYFDKATQQSVLQKLIGKLKKGGYLFIGHSESLFQLHLPIVQIKPTVYKKV